MLELDAKPNAPPDTALHNSRTNRKPVPAITSGTLPGLEANATTVRSDDDALGAIWGQPLRLTLAVWKQLWGRDARAFALLERSAESAHASTTGLLAAIQPGGAPSALILFASTLRKNKPQKDELTDYVCTAHVMPMDGEDIKALSGALQNIQRAVETFAERVALGPQQTQALRTAGQLQLLAKAADALVPMVKGLRQSGNIEAGKSHHDQLQQIEGEADKLMLESLRQLYNGQHTPLEAIIQKDFFELLEKIFDRYRDAGNAIFRIMLKEA